MARLTPEADRPSASAARVKPPLSTTLANTLTPESRRASNDMLTPEFESQMM